MGRPAKGEFRRLASGWEARIRIHDDGMRRGFFLAAFPTDEAAARQRCEDMATIAVRLRRAGHEADVPKLLELAAKTRPGKPWEAILAAVDRLCDGTTTELQPNETTTVQKLGESWRSGELHRRFRDHVGKKKDRSVQRDDEIARLYVDPHIGDWNVADVELEQCEVVMSAIPGDKSPALRRAVAQYLRRLMQMTVYPLRLRSANPIPRGWLPRVPDNVAKECLYPDEDRALLSCVDVPLLRRLCYGFLDREGMRADEAGELQWRDVDLVRGRVDLDENKTDDPRDWDLDPSVWRALRAWKERFHPDAAPSDKVFAESSVPINVNRLAGHLRKDLHRAGVTREKLFERSTHRRPIRAHDLRATFVTVALATGKTEAFVTDRTGHKSSGMVNRYRRKARGWNMGALDPLDVAIPELRSAPHERPTTPSEGASSGAVGGHILEEFAWRQPSPGDAQILRIDFRSARRPQRAAR